MKRSLSVLLVLMLLVPISLSVGDHAPTVEANSAYADWHWPEWVVELVKAFCDAFPEACDGCEYC